MRAEDVAVDAVLFEERRFAECWFPGCILADFVCACEGGAGGCECFVETGDGTGDSCLEGWDACFVDCGACLGACCAAWVAFDAGGDAPLDWLAAGSTAFFGDCFMVSFGKDLAAVAEGSPGADFGVGLGTLFGVNDAATFDDGVLAAVDVADNGRGDGLATVCCCALFIGDAFSVVC